MDFKNCEEARTSRAVMTGRYGSGRVRFQSTLLFNPRFDKGAVSEKFSKFYSINLIVSKFSTEFFRFFL